MGTRRESERDCDKGSINETGLSPRAGQQASIDFLEVDAVAIDAELMSRPRHVDSHVNDMQKMTMAQFPYAVEEGNDNNYCLRA